MKLTFTTLLCFLVCISLFAQEDLPPNAEPGKCYAQCITSDRYETTSETYQVKDASSRIEVVPAQW